MKRVWRNGGRVMSAILAAAMILTSLPVSGVTVYADETTSQVVTETADTENSAETVADEETSLEGENADEGETPADGVASSDGTTATDDEAAMDGETATDGESAVDDKTTSEEASAEEETTADAVAAGGEDSERIVSDTNITLDDGYTILDAEADYTWDGTTVMGLNYEITDSNERLSLVIPAKATAIGSLAFKRNGNICRVSFSGNNVTSIGTAAFIDCAQLEQADLPAGLQTIGSQAFEDCTALKVDLPEGLQAIGDLAFGNCSALKSVTIPDTIETIGWRVFDECTGIETVTIEAWNFATDECGRIFRNCTALRHVSFGQVTSVPDRMFEGCTSLQEITFPEGLQKTGMYVFENCSSLESVVLPDTLETIGNHMFDGCTSLQRLVIPGSVTSIGYNIFSGCTSLTYLEFGEGMTTIPATGATNVRTVVLPSTVEVIQRQAFLGCGSLTTINLPASLKSIENSAFGVTDSESGIKIALDQITELRFEGDGNIDIQPHAFNGVYNTRNIPVYCVAGSKVYDYFDGQKGFTLITNNAIRYVLNGGTNAADNPTNYTTGDDLTFQDPTRPGYAFDGWYTDSKFTKPFVYDKNSTHGDLDLYAKWNEISYTITYDLNGGTLPKGKTNPAAYTASKDVTLVAPTRAGAAFAGWLVNGTDTVITNGKIAANTYAQDLTLIAQWREYSYQLIWNKNAKDAAGTMDSVTLAVSQVYTIPEEGYTRAGYDFLGWNTAANGKGKSYVDGDVVQGLAAKDGAKVTLYAQWQKSLYEINYVLNDSETSPAVNHKSNPDSYSVAQKVSLKAPTRTGCTFGGWYEDAAFTTKVTTITSAMGDVTVYAKWTPITYTITFNKNKGTLPAGASMNNITAQYDELVTLPENAFVRTGYTFLGWDLTASSKAAEPTYTDGQEVNNLSSKNKAEVTLYAKWQVNQIPIKYVLNDSEEDPATNPAKNPAYVTIEKNVVLAAPTRAGYKFGGWYTDKALTQALAKNTIAKTTTDPITVYASWIENSYTLKLDKNGGTYDIPQDVVGKHEYEEEFLLPDGTGASRENYTFTGWNTRKDRSGEHYGLDPETGENKPVSGLATKGTVTLYAEWTPVEGRTYTITYYNVDGGDNSKNPDTYSFEKDVKLVNPTRTGYTFKGWYAEDPAENPKAEKVTTISKKTTGNVEVYGVWTENTYTIAYNGNKGTLPKSVKMAAQTAAYSEEVTLTTNAFTRKGYEFDGWNTKANGTGTKVDGEVGNYTDGDTVQSLTAKNKGKVTLYAQWKAIDYTITYVGAENGVDGVVNTNPMTYTIAKDVKLVNPTAYGYTFKGWYNDDPETNAKAGKVTKIAKTTCKDMTVYALWSENKYNLRFSTNSQQGGSVKSITNRLYTDGFNLPAAAPKDGYTFQGWALTRNGEALFHAGDAVTFADIHEAGGTAKGLVGTKYFTLYAVFAEE